MLLPFAAGYPCQDSAPLINDPSETLTLVFQAANRCRGITVTTVSSLFGNEPSSTGAPRFPIIRLILEFHEI